MSYGISRIPTSAQADVHERLDGLVRRHLAQPFRKPYAPYNLAAFEATLAAWDGRSPWILDSGCGVGWSTILLARRNPDAFVVGVDQSQERLSRQKPYPRASWPENLRFVRADVIDFWRLAVESGVPVREHWWLYPNPWPKIGHLGRRWYAHPVWPAVLRLGGRFECRTNWSVYARELTAALALSGIKGECTPFVPEEPMTPFERKYRDSGQTLWRVRADLSAFARGELGARPAEGT